MRVSDTKADHIVFMGDMNLGPDAKISAGRSEPEQQTAQLCNPPMVHGLACCGRPDGASGGFVAAARGDGCVALYSTSDATKMRRGKKGSHLQPGQPLFSSTSHDAAASCM